MAWTKGALIEEETFAGPSVEQFVEFEGCFERRLNLNQIGSWTTMWIVFLMSVRAVRADLYAPTTVAYRDNPYWQRMTYGIRSSASSYPPYSSSLVPDYPDCRQWIGATGSLSGSPEVHKGVVTGKHYVKFSEWRALYKEDGTRVNYSGGQLHYDCLDVGPSIRRPWAIAIQKNATTSVGSSVPGAGDLADVTKQGCKDWLLNNSTSLDFIFNRPSGNTYGPLTNSGHDIAEGTYGALDTIFFACNKPGYIFRCHGIWGRTFSTAV